MLTRHPRFHLPRRRRGSVLVVAVILATVVALSLASYLSLGHTSLVIASRALYQNAAVNLAETGLEEAMWSINHNLQGDTEAWTSWTAQGFNRWRHFTGFSFDQNATGEVRVYIENATSPSSAPVIISRATVTPVTGDTIEKYIEVKLRRRSRFANGLVAKDSILFKGNNASVDSWNSDPDSDSSTAAIPYSSSVRNDNGTAASISVSVDAVLVQNADIWGYAATGQEQPQVGSNGSILGADSPSGIKVDPNRISTDFSSNFDDVTTPTETPYSLGGISNSISLPRAGDSAASDGKYYYTTSGISLASSKTVTISSGDVVLTTTGDVSFTGQASLQIAPSATLVVYAGDDFKIGGNGVANGALSGGVTNSTAGQPVNFQIYGTASSSQDIEIKGNGAFSGIVYAPNGDIFINGNGDVSGSVIGENITVVGNAAFHYDESLADLDAGSPYGITKWTELTTASDRAAVLSEVSFE